MRTLIGAEYAVPKDNNITDKIPQKVIFAAKVPFTGIKKPKIVMKIFEMNKVKNCDCKVMEKL